MNNKPESAHVFTAEEAKAMLNWGTDPVETESATDDVISDTVPGQWTTDNSPVEVEEVSNSGTQLSDNALDDIEATVDEQYTAEPEEA